MGPWTARMEHRMHRLSIRHLGSQIDIHGGGSDRIYPHTKTRLPRLSAPTARRRSARTGCTTNAPTRRREMSKSLGNLVLARVLMQTYEPDQLRLYLLSNHLRTDANYHEGDLDSLAESYGQLKAAATTEATGGGVLAGTPLVREFEAAMDDDFAVPRAIEVLDASARRINSGAIANEAPALRASLAVLGLGSPAPWSRQRRLQPVAGAIPKRARTSSVSLPNPARRRRPLLASR